MSTSTLIQGALRRIKALEEVPTSDVLDFLTSTRGSVLYRGAAGWAGLSPGTAGYALVSSGAGADPVYAPILSGGSAVMVNPLFSASTLTGTRQITTTNTVAVYVGTAAKSAASANLRARVTIAMSAITWGEVAIAKGSVNVGGNPTLTVLGYTNVAATWNSTGQKTTAITAAITKGDDLWALIGNQASTPVTVRAQTTADDLQVGMQAILATRPSLNVGTPQAYTLEGATILAPWVALVL